MTGIEVTCPTLSWIAKDHMNCPSLVNSLVIIHETLNTDDLLTRMSDTHATSIAVIILR